MREIQTLVGGQLPSEPAVDLAELRDLGQAVEEEAVDVDPASLEQVGHRFAAKQRVEQN